MLFTLYQHLSESRRLAKSTLFSNQPLHYSIASFASHSPLSLSSTPPTSSPLHALTPSPLFTMPTGTSVESAAIANSKSDDFAANMPSVDHSVCSGVVSFSDNNLSAEPTAVLADCAENTLAPPNGALNAAKVSDFEACDQSIIAVRLFCQNCVIHSIFLNLCSISPAYHSISHPVFSPTRMSWSLLRRRPIGCVSIRAFSIFHPFPLSCR
jgi:hypothetical protein